MNNIIYSGELDFSNLKYIDIQKLKKNIPISHTELEELERILFDGKERGTKDDFVKMHGEQPLGNFIRSIVGMDTQIRFIDMLIDFLTKKGIIVPEMLFDEPFTNFHTGGINGLFNDEYTKKILTILDRIDRNAAA